MAITLRETHFQPGGEVCETAHLSDGRVLRVVGYESRFSVTSELRAWLVWLGLAIFLVACGGQPFEPGLLVADAVLVDSGGGEEASAPDARADSGGAESSTDAGSEMEATTGDDASDGSRDAAIDVVPTGPCDGGPLVAHSDGLGGMWTDCAPIDTYSAAEATAACAAHYTSDCVVYNCGGVMPNCVGYYAPYQSYCWQYNSDGGGRVVQWQNMTGACVAPYQQVAIWH